jgi:hypothetical protein
VILVLVPLVGVVLGVALYVILRGIGVFNILGGEPPTREARSYRASGEWRSRGLSLGERLDAVPRGCLIAIIVVAGIWIIGWLVVLLVGLSFLS